MNIVSIEQNTDAWLEYRRAFFNASDAPAMLGCSSYKTRTELLNQIKTGIAPEIDGRTQRIFDEGHRIEQLARPIAEQIIGEDLAPLVGNDGDKLSASFDGITMSEDIVFEHKTLNSKLRDAMHDGCAGTDLPLEYQAQMEQQCIVSGCSKVLFMASTWDGDDLIEERHCWYVPDLELRQRIIAGWRQFATDLGDYTPTPTPAPAPVVEQESLPSVSVRVNGALAVASNLDVFSVALHDFVARIPERPETDQQFAECEAACKTLKKAEDALIVAENGALAQISDVETMRNAVATLSKLARDVRLRTEKLVKAEKQNRKAQIVMAAAEALTGHYAALNKRWSKPHMPPAEAQWANVIKGKSSLANMQAAIDAELARCKIEGNRIADLIDANRKVLAEVAAGYEGLFRDADDLLIKPTDDVRSIAAGRVAEAKAAEAARLEAERQRIEAAAKAKAEAEARALAEAERQRIRAEEEAKAREAQKRVDEAVSAEHARLRAAQRQADADARALVNREEQEHATPRGEPAPAPTAVSAVAGGTARAVEAGGAESHKPTLTLGAINARLAPISISGAGMSEFGIEPLATDKRAKLYSEAQFGNLLCELSDHLSRVAAWACKQPEVETA